MNNIFYGSFFLLQHNKQIETGDMDSWK